MQCSWIICSIFYMTGAVLKGIKADEKSNNTETSTDSSLDDYDPSYPDNTDRDYPNYDYYDDREGRNLNHDHNSYADDDNHENHKQDVDEYMMRQLQSTIPGTPGVDYALYQTVPDTSFQCGNQQHPGFYGDVESQCQVFHICQEDGRQDSFLCPIGTVFNQISFICDWWFNFRCEGTPMYYHLNDKFHTPSGSTSMRDTMKRMRNFQDDKNMNMIMGLAKVHKKLHSIQNMMNNDSEKRSKTPRPINLFMLGMRKNKLGRIRAPQTSKRSTDDEVTASDLPTAGTPLALTALSSTGYVDISLTEYTTTNNSSHVDSSINKMSVPEFTDNVTESSNATEVLPHTAGFNVPFKSVLNLSSIEMVINGSIVTTVKLEHSDVAHIESTTLAESTSIETYIMNKTEETVNVTNYETERNENEPVENHLEMEPESEKLFSEKDTGVIEKNIIVSTPKVIPEQPTSPPPSKPFSHENNFIIGNDTHISVSVTIHSKSGSSKLQWKRLPGIKRIRKIRFKNTEESTTTQNSNNDATYKKRNNGEKPRSRIMWIPAKKNALERKMDWKTFLEFRDYGTIVSAKTEQNQPLKELEKAAVENSAIPSINISDTIYYTEDSYANDGNHESTSDTVTTENVTEYSTIIHLPVNTDILSALLKTTEESSDSYAKVENVSEASTEFHREIEIQPNLTENHSEETKDDCRTICIKLLRNLHGNSRNFSNSTNFENGPSSLTLFNDDSSETQQDPKYGRKSVLGVSSSEQWTVKYDPGPNCNENAEDDKVLIKGWSVIIDTGSVTKEKTVKKRGCASSSDSRRVLVMGNSDKNSGDKGITFNTETSPIPLNSQKHFGSTDQRYWFNLVRNWLEQSPNIKTGAQKFDQNTPADQEWRTDKFPNSRNEKRHDTPQIPNRQNEYNYDSDNSNGNNFPKYKANLGHRNQKIKHDVKYLARNSKDQAQFPRNNENQRQFNIRTSKPDWQSDLQTERSDWFHATQRANDRNNKGIGNKRSTRGNMRDWSSESSNTGGNPMAYRNKDSSNQGFDSKNHDLDTRDDLESKTRQDSSVSEDYDDWSSKQTSIEDWDGNRENYEWKTKMDKRDWSGETSQDHDGWDSKTSRGGDGWDSRQDDWSSKGNKRTAAQDKMTWPKSDKGASKDWSGGRQNKHKGSRDDTTISWKQDTKSLDSSDNYWMNKKNFQDGSVSRSNKGQRNWPPNSMKGTKGRSVSDEWNWAPEKGFDTNIRSMSEDRRNDWSSQKSRDTDWSNKKNPRRDDDWRSRRPNMSRNRPTEDKDGRRDWSSDDQNNWNKDFDPQWSMDGGRNNDRRSSDGRRSNMPKGIRGWNSEENNWKDEEQTYPRSDGWNLEKGSDTKDVSRGSRGDWNSQTNKKPDWSLGSRGGRNKGSTVNTMYSPRWSSQNNPEQAEDRKTNRPWSSKTSPEDSRRPPNHSSRRPNDKGDPSIGFKRPEVHRSPKKSWDTDNRNDRDDNKQTWMTVPSGSKTQKGTQKTFKNPAMNNPGWKSDTLDSQEWFSEDDKDDSHDISWNLRKGMTDSRRRSSKNDNEWVTRKKMESDSWPNRTPITKSNKGDERSVSRSDVWDENNSFSKGADSWPAKNPVDDKSKANNQNSGSKRNRNSWGSTKGDSRGSMRTPQAPSRKGESRSKPTMPWKNGNSSKNFTKGGSEMKKIVWSSLINSDGKPGNGWVPITLRPDLRARANRSRNDRNNKGSSTDEENWPIEDSKKADWSNKVSSRDEGNWTDEDMKNTDWNNKASSTDEENWPVEDMKNTDWNSEISQYSQTAPAEASDEATEASPSTSEMSEASFSQLFYIPAFRSRYKREYQNGRKIRLQARDITNKSYKIIKSGEVLNDVSRGGNNFFLATANILVEDHRDPNKRKILYPGLKRTVNQETIEISSINSQSGVANNNTKNNFQQHSKEVKQWDEFPKESAIHERWSSPFNSHNFSASGWIPVTTFKPSNSRNLTYVNSFLQNKSSKITAVNSLHNKTKENDFHIRVTDMILDHFTVKNVSHDLQSSPQPKSFDILLHDKESNHTQNKTDKIILDSENGTEMKVGNQTLRILSFSDVMKQLKNEKNPFQDSYSFDPDGISWNVPITIDPRTYSLKLIEPSNKTKENISNSWSFPSNGNHTKHAWILVGTDNNTKQSSLNKTANISETNRNLYHEKTERYNETVGNRTTASEEKEHLYNSTEQSEHRGAQLNNNTFSFKSRNWDSDSDWRPVIRKVGRVVSYNRTLLLSKESSVK